MKTNEEIMAELLKRRDNYEKEQTKNMKKTTVSILTVILAAALSVSIFAIAKTDGDVDYLVPIRSYPEPTEFGTPTPVVANPSGGMSAIWDRSHTIGEAYESADMVADIIITEWLTETKYGTYFKARILNVYKDNIGYTDQDIIFAQSGTSNSPFDDFPIYNVGTKMLLCLCYYEGSEYEPGPGFYAEWEQMTELYYIDINGETYLARSSAFENLSDIEKFCSVDDSELCEELYGSQNVNMNVDMTDAAAINFNNAAEHVLDKFHGTKIFAVEDVLKYMYSLEHGE